MTLQAPNLDGDGVPQNSISFLNIATEFGYPTGNSFGAYRISPETYGGKTFTQLDAGIPNSGEIKFSDFYSKSLNCVVDCWSNGNSSGSTAEDRVNVKSNKSCK